MQLILQVYFIAIIMWNYGEGAKRINIQKRMADKMMHFKSPINRRSLEVRHAKMKDILELHDGEDLEEVTSIQTAKGTLKTKLQETYKGIPVFGEHVVVEKTKNGELTGKITGKLLEDIKDDVGSITPKISTQEALQIALAEKHLTKEDVEFDENEAKLEIYIKEEGDIHVKGKLAYIFSFLADSPTGPSEPVFVIDANSGSILDQWEGLQSGVRVEKRNTEFIEVFGTGGNKKLGRHKFGIDYDKLTVKKEGNKCSLENDYVRVIDAKDGYYRKAKNTFSYTCDKERNDEKNGAYSPPNDVFFFGTATFKMYKDWFNIKPLSYRLNMYVNVYRAWPNAAWNGKDVLFGNGGTTLYPPVTHGVVSHEIAHGFTAKNSKLVYKNQSGGMNEAFSDISAEALEFYVKNKVDYAIGKGIFRGSNRPLRYLDNPKKDGHSINHISDYRDGLNVHYSSGIFNRAFSILAKKSNWDPKKAFHVFLIANKMYWHENSKFKDGAVGVKHAAKDLGYSEKDVTDAFRPVGIVM